MWKCRRSCNSSYLFRTQIKSQNIWGCCALCLVCVCVWAQMYANGWVSECTEWAMVLNSVLLSCLWNEIKIRQTARSHTSDTLSVSLSPTLSLCRVWNRDIALSKIVLSFCVTFPSWVFPNGLRLEWANRAKQYSDVNEWSTDIKRRRQKESRCNFSVFINDSLPNYLKGYHGQRSRKRSTLIRLWR